MLESAPLGTTVGTLSTTDTTPGDTFTYSLVSGDSSSFSISADTLRTATVFDYATQGSYNVRVRATDATGRFFEQDFTITVNPAGEIDVSPMLDTSEESQQLFGRFRGTTIRRPAEIQHHPAADACTWHRSEVFVAG